MGCYNSTVVSAPVNEVWALLRNFHDNPLYKALLGALKNHV